MIECAEAAAGWRPQATRRVRLRGVGAEHRVPGWREAPRGFGRRLAKRIRTGPVQLQQADAAVRRQDVALARRRGDRLRGCRRAPVYPESCPDLRLCRRWMRSPIRLRAISSLRRRTGFGNRERCSHVRIEGAGSRETAAAGRLRESKRCNNVELGTDVSGRCHHRRHLRLWWHCKHSVGDRTDSVRDLPCAVPCQPSRRVDARQAAGRLGGDVPGAIAAQEAIRLSTRGAKNRSSFFAQAARASNIGSGNVSATTVPPPSRPETLVVPPTCCAKAWINREPIPCVEPSWCC